jgi:uncharacterized protein YodC (DUF2158 family)
MRINSAVRASGTPIMKLVAFRPGGTALCVWVNGDGIVKRRAFDLDVLFPFWETLSPRCLWPEVNQFDLLEIEKEERVAAESRRAERRVARKSRRSRKIKRGVVA